jgi:hypothetical protein
VFPFTFYPRIASLQVIEPIPATSESGGAALHTISTTKPISPSTNFFEPQEISK